jgi:DNA-binding NarL/FixJ family response regulator
VLYRPTPVRIFVVDDSAPFRQFVSSILQQRPEWQVICNASDGLEAVQKAEQLQPDLILLDIGLPKLNGIEAARRIGKVAPQSKILFLSIESSADVVREALSLGARGFLLKAWAQQDLSAAVEAVLEGKQFVSSALAGHLPSSERCS